MATKAFPLLKSLLVLALCALQPVFGVQGGGLKPAIEPTLKTGQLQAKQPAGQAEQGGANKLVAVADQAKPKEGAKLVASEAATSAFPKINPRWQKWQLGVFNEVARKNNWGVLPANSVRLVSHSGTLNAVTPSFQVDLQTGKATVLAGTGHTGSVRSFTLQPPELENLRKKLESKEYRDLAEEGREAGRDGNGVLIESDWKGDYHWRINWVETPPVVEEISTILNKTYQRGH